MGFNSITGSTGEIVEKGTTNKSGGTNNYKVCTVPPLDFLHRDIQL